MIPDPPRQSPSLLRIFCVGDVSYDERGAFRSSCWFPLFSIMLYAAVASAVPLVCYFTGQAYEYMLFEREEDRTPAFWLYKGWLIVAIFLEVYYWMRFLQAVLVTKIGGRLSFL